MNLSVASSIRMTIDSNGSVGIGTTSPLKTLHVESTAESALFRGSATWGAAFQISASAAGGKYWQIQATANAAGEGAGKFIITDRDNSATRFAIDSTGNVGIGTTSPGAKLDVAGSLTVGTGVTGASTDIKISNSSNAKTHYIFSDVSSGELGIEAGASVGIKFNTNTTNTRMVILSGGNVGIGTTSPGAKLDVAGTFRASGAGIHIINSSDDTVPLRLTTTTATNNSRLGFGTLNSANSYNISVGAYATSSLGFWTNDTVQGHINSSGIFTYSGGNLLVTNGIIGIGTSSPSRGLTINRTNEFAALNIIKNNTGNQIVYLGTGSGGADDLGILQLSDGGTVKVQLYSGGVSYFNSGNVGIGTTSPAYKLDINGGAADTTLAVQTTGQNAVRLRLANEERNFTLTNNPGDDLLSFSYDGSNRLQFNLSNQWFNSGNVGIGTTSPASILHVVGSGRFSSTSTTAQSANVGLYLSIGLSSLNYNGILFQGVSATDMYFGRGAGASVDDLVIVGTSELVRFKANGSVGIGNTSPDAKLVIGEDSSSSNVGYIRLRGHDIYEANIYKTSDYGLYIDVDSNAKPIRIDGSAFITGITGNVGIGTTSPSYKLHVVGTGTAINLAVIGNIRAAGTGTSGGEVIASGGIGNGNYVALRHDDTNGYVTVTRTVYAGHLILEPYANVGIGTTTPTAKLTVQGTQVELHVKNDTTNTLTAGGWDGSRHYIKSINLGVALTPLTLQASSFTFDTGNVGIGTTSPVARLDVAGRIAAGEDLFLKRTDSDFGFITRPNTTGYKKAGFLVNGGGNLTDFYIYSDLSYFSGNVGIGTTNPAQKLDVRGYIVSDSQGNGSESAFYLGNSSHGLSRANSQNNIVLYTTAGDVILSASTSGTTHLIVKNNGNVGIGTTNPSNGTLQIYNTSGNTLSLQKSSGAPAISFGDASTNYGLIESINGGGFNFYTGNGTVTSKMVILTGGNVGIGTPSPSYILQTKDMGVGSSNAYFGTGMVRIGGGADAGSNQVLSLAPGRFGMDNPGVSNGRFVIEENGRVGIGIASPSSILHTYTTTNADNAGHIQYENGNTGTGSSANAQLIGKSKYGTLQLMVWENYGIRFGMRSTANGGAGDIYFTTGTDSTQMVIKGGSVGIGTTSPAYLLDVTGTGRFTSTLNVDSRLVQGTGGQRSTNGTTIALTNNTTFVANSDIGDGQRFLSIVNESTTTSVFSNICFRISPNSSTTMLDMKFVNNGSSNSTLYWTFNSAGGFNDRLTLTSAGTLTAAGDVVAFSDARLKENIITIDNAVEKVTSMRGVFFNKKDDETKSRRSGVIAQEIQEILPEVVTESADGTLGVAYGNMAGVFIEAIKELKAQNDALLARIEQLENK
jgi:hypothetical protein